MDGLKHVCKRSFDKSFLKVVIDYARDGSKKEEIQGAGELIMTHGCYTKSLDETHINKPLFDLIDNINHKGCEKKRKKKDPHRENRCFL